MVLRPVRDKTLRAGTAPCSSEHTPPASQRDSMPLGLPVISSPHAWLASIAGLVNLMRSRRCDSSRSARSPSTVIGPTGESSVHPGLSRRIGPARIHGGHFGGISRRHEGAVGSRRQSPSLSLGLCPGAVSSRSNSLQRGWRRPALVLPVNVHRVSAAGSDPRQEGRSGCPRMG
jgi:hypothetical protein